MRTLSLVALGAASITVASIQFGDLIEHPDPLSRILQGILQGVIMGIGFIGAGVIMRDRKTRQIEGLTTAATVWVAAAVGIACGLAAWTTAALAIGIALAVLVGAPPA